MMSESSEFQVKLSRKYLKIKIIEDDITFRGHSVERNDLYDLLRRTIKNGEAHSAIVIGPRGSGKTTMINSVLTEISQEVDMQECVVVKLNGLLHHDDNVALKSITVQMKLENAVGDKVFGTFTENLNYLLHCILNDPQHRCRSMVFILEQFHRFCHAGRMQNLLYNLFDVTHSKQAPMSVIGITNKLDVIDLLEKRVSSRFSHRHIFIFPTEDTETDLKPNMVARTPLQTYLDTFVTLLSLPAREKRKKKNIKKYGAESKNKTYEIPQQVLTKCNVDPNIFSEFTQEYVEEWNEHILELSQNQKVIDSIEKFCYYTLNEQIFRNILITCISTLSPCKSKIMATEIIQAIDKTVEAEHRVSLVQSLSILELSLLIAMKQGMDIFDGQPMNFEMVLHRYKKFANTNSSIQTVPRSVIMKAFSHLETLELITPVGSEGMYSQNTTVSRVQKEYQLFSLTVPIQDLDAAVKGFKALPTEITHWYHNSVY